MVEYSDIVRRVATKLASNQPIHRDEIQSLFKCAAYLDTTHQELEDEIEKAFTRGQNSMLDAGYSLT